VNRRENHKHIWTITIGRKLSVDLYSDGQPSGLIATPVVSANLAINVELVSIVELALAVTLHCTDRVALKCRACVRCRVGADSHLY
jgi:hypothetical protein